MTDWRRLCAELASYLQGRKNDECGWGGEDPEQDLLDYTRAELAQPEPEGPTDQEIADTFAQGCREGAGNPDQPPFLAGARAVLARWGRPAIEPVPASEPEVKP